MTFETPAYDPDNVFARILRGELPCHKVHEDERCLVFMDIMPRADGHVLVIPKAPSRNILDAGEDDLKHLVLIVQRVARAAKDAFRADGVVVSQFSESAGGQVVFHTHFHVIPRQEGIDLRPAGINGDHAALAEHAARLSEAFSRQRSRA